MRFVSTFFITVKKGFFDFFKDFIWLFTFFALIFKTMLFLGLIFSQDHTSVSLSIIKWLVGFSFPAYVCFIAVILSFSFLLKARKKYIFLIVVNFLVSLLTLIDLWNYRAFESFPSIHSIVELSNIYNLGGSITSMIHLIDVLFLVDIPVLIIILLITWKKEIWNRFLNRNILVYALLFIFSLGVICLYHYKVDIQKHFKGQNFFTVCWTPRTTMKNLSPIGYHLFDVYVYWQDNRPLKLKESEKKEIRDWFLAKRENLPDNKYKGMFKGKNLIFIETESLENCVINQKADNQEVTPVINGLLKNSIYFPNFYEQVRGGTSSDAMLISNASIYPVIRGITFYRFSNNTYNPVSALMKGIGYKTLAAEPDRGSYWNWMENFYNFGYDKCLDVSNFKYDEKIGMGLSDGSFLKQLVPVAKKLKQPFFMYMVTQTTHTPYSLPKEYRELSLPASVDNTKLGGYLQSLHYTDRQIGVFLSKLDKSGLLDNSVVVIYGDHGGMHKFYPNEVEDVQPQESWWQENNFRVPFIIYSKGMKGEKVDTIGGEVDILPTVAYLMGVDEKEYIDTAMGRNLLNTRKSFAVLYNRTYIGSSNDPEEKNRAVKGIDIADLIIRSNYFKNMDKK